MLHASRHVQHLHVNTFSVSKLISTKSFYDALCCSISGRWKNSKISDANLFCLFRDDFNMWQIETSLLILLVTVRSFTGDKINHEVIAYLEAAKFINNFFSIFPCDDRCRKNFGKPVLLNDKHGSIFKPIWLLTQHNKNSIETETSIDSVRSEKKINYRFLRSHVLKHANIIKSFPCSQLN